MLSGLTMACVPASGAVVTATSLGAASTAAATTCLGAASAAAATTCFGAASGAPATTTFFPGPATKYHAAPPPARPRTPMRMPITSPVFDDGAAGVTTD